MLRTSLKFSLFVLALAPLACGGDGDQNDDTNNDSTGGDDDDDDDDDDATDPDADATDPDADADATDPDATATDTSATDPDTGSTDATAGSSTGEECTPDDACIIDDDCLPGQMCIGCLCLGDPTGCREYGEGEFGDCVTAGGNDVCMSDAGLCVVDDPMNATAGVCYFPCEEECDCPAPPAGFEDLLACDAVVGAPDSPLECLLDCSGGEDCPDGMYCFANTICFWGEEPSGIPPYGDCQNLEGACEGGVCVQGPDFAVCATPCDTAADCAMAPATGDAEVTCDNITEGDDDPECWLSCQGGAECPDGMSCFMNFICVWDEIVIPPYNDCSTDATACLAGEECTDDGEGGICGESDCADAGDCPAAPATGDAVPACGDLGAGNNVCYLDCMGGEACPDDMVCSDGGYCHFAG